MTTEPAAKQNRGHQSLIARFRNGAPAYVRIPVGFLFILGGVFSFLPVLGLWMLPVGLAILAPSFPFAAKLRRKLLALAAKLRRSWRGLRGGVPGKRG